ncbi:MAG TPA: hypothetical protein VMS17_09865 [Gemmataceae bacterium]|nr:hypothetical protein [Gemmataceae bacterium]
MPLCVMRAYAVLLVFLAAGLGIAASQGQYGWWSPFLVPLALLFASLMGQHGLNHDQQP